MARSSKPSYTCPVCSSKDTRKSLTASHTHGGTLLDTKKFHYYMCQRCNAIFLIDTTFNKSYYDTYYNFEGYYGENAGIKKVIENFLDKCSQANKRSIITSSIDKKGKIKILDVGAGEGKFLSSLDSSHFDKYGIELDKKSSEICREKGLTVYNEDILKKDFSNKKFDIITLWHVVEHIPHPPKLMKKLSTLLAKNGRIIISTPNTKCLGFRSAKEQWFHMDAPRHVILFSEETIATLCKETTFAVESVHSERFEFPFDLYWSFKKSNSVSSLSLLSPLLKFFDKETLTYVIKKSHTN